MQNVPELLATVKAAYPYPCPAEQSSGTAYSVAGAFLQYLRQHDLLSVDACHDLAIYPHSMPRYPDAALLTDVLCYLNPALDGALAYATALHRANEDGDYPLAYDVLERALTPHQQEA